MACTCASDLLPIQLSLWWFKVCFDADDHLLYHRPPPSTVAHIIAGSHVWGDNNGIYGFEVTAGAFRCPCRALRVPHVTLGLF